MDGRGRVGEGGSDRMVAGEGTAAGVEVVNGGTDDSGLTRWRPIKLTRRTVTSQSDEFSTSLRRNNASDLPIGASLADNVRCFYVYTSTHNF